MEQTDSQAAASPGPEDRQLADTLLRRGLVTNEQLDQARQAQAERGQSLWRILVSMNLVTPQQVASAMGRSVQAPPTAGGPTAVEPGRSAESIQEELKRAVQSQTPSELVQSIFNAAFETRTTDIHFDPHEEGIRVRFRVDGHLHDIVELTSEQAPTTLSRIKILANMDIVERRAAQDGHINLPGADHDHDLRIATVPTSLGEKLVVRVLDTAAMLTGLDQLGLEPSQVESLQRLTGNPYGMMLVAGPVGSGKTTTLYSCLNRVNQPVKNVMTIEDPVEYRLKGVNQLQVDGKTDFTFAAGLRALMRQDPDVIMIGEIRDDETAKIGVQAAMTGVLVFSSIHASDAAAVVGNLYNYKIPGFLISTAMLGVAAQRLVRRVCPYCKESYEPDESVLRMLALKGDGANGELELFRGTGCANCFSTGYLGRTGVFEIMELGDELKELVFRETVKDVIRQVAIDSGMQTLRASTANKVVEGTSTVEEMLRTILA